MANARLYTLYTAGLYVYHATKFRLCLFVFKQILCTCTHNNIILTCAFSVFRRCRNTAEEWASNPRWCWRPRWWPSWPCPWPRSRPRTTCTTTPAATTGCPASGRSRASSTRSANGRSSTSSARACTTRRYSPGWTGCARTVTTCSGNHSSTRFAGSHLPTRIFPRGAHPSPVFFLHVTEKKKRRRQTLIVNR